MNQKIYDYVDKARLQGKTDNKIAEELKGIGITEGELNEIFSIPKVGVVPVQASPSKSSGRTFKENVDIITVPLILHVLLGPIISVPILLISTFVIARKKTYFIKDGLIVGALFGILTSIWNVVINLIVSKQYADMNIIVYFILSIFGSGFMIILYIVLVVAVIVVTNKFFKKR